MATNKEKSLEIAHILLGLSTLMVILILCSLLIAFTALTLDFIMMQILPIIMVLIALILVILLSELIGIFICNIIRTLYLNMFKTK